ncbi:5'-nucleotidase [Paenibacillus taichungensis]|uniref:5'-nucleotidase n=1 Tax=Paenibacillus taichungensis TaxID=484184 RepID=UPI0035D7BED7
MAYSLEDIFVVAVSSRALFDLTEENRIFQLEGLEKYSSHQLEHESKVLKPGIAFSLIKALLHLNKHSESKRLIEVVVMSRNNADTSLRIFNSIQNYELDITRAALTSGRPLATYLEAFKVDLFLSADEIDVQDAVNAGVAAGLVFESESSYDEDKTDTIKIAFDGDAVLFSDESEKIYQSKGLDAFIEHEKLNVDIPLPEGPFAKMLKHLSFIQKQFPAESNPIRTALVTARNSPAHERVILTLRAWGVRIDEAFFLGGISKGSVLKAFGAQIFFDDQETHLNNSAKVVPSFKVLPKQQKLSIE